MASPIRPALTADVTLINEITTALVITSETAAGATVETAGRTFTDAALRKSPGSWGLPPSGIAPGSATPKN